MLPDEVPLRDAPVVVDELQPLCVPERLARDVVAGPSLGGRGRPVDVAARQREEERAELRSWLEGVAAWAVLLGGGGVPEPAE